MTRYKQKIPLRNLILHRKIPHHTDGEQYSEDSLNPQVEAKGTVPSPTNYH